MDFITILEYTRDTTLAGIATFLFTIIFQSPKSDRVFAGIVGGFGWLIYMLFMDFGVGVVFASFYATVGLTLLARYFSYFKKSPVISFLIPGVFPLVPGAGIYSTGYHLFMNSHNEALSIGLQTAQIAIAMALGIGLVNSLPQIMFSFKRRKNIGV